MSNFVFHLKSRPDFASATISEYQPILRLVRQRLAHTPDAKISIFVSGAWLVAAKKSQPALIRQLYQLGRRPNVQLILSRRDLPTIDVLTTRRPRIRRAPLALAPATTTPTAPAAPDDDTFYVKVHRLDAAAEIPDSDAQVLPSDDWDDLIYAPEETDELDEAAMAIQILAQRLARQKAALEHQVDALAEGEIIL